MTFLGFAENVLTLLKRIEGPLKILLAPLTILIGLIYSVITFAHSMLQWVLSQIDDVIADMELEVGDHQLDTIATDFWILINTFIPLDTIFVLAGILFSVRVVFAVTRIIKSFVPSISG